jgi:hypothetical protein
MKTKKMLHLFLTAAMSVMLVFSVAACADNNDANVIVEDDANAAPGGDANVDVNTPDADTNVDVNTDANTTDNAPANDSKNDGATSTDGNATTTP